MMGGAGMMNIVESSRVGSSWFESFDSVESIRVWTSISIGERGFEWGEIDELKSGRRASQRCAIKD
jgi:hypothetical protein